MHAGRQAVFLSLYILLIWSKTLFSVQIKEYEKLQTHEDRLAMARKIFDKYIMCELLSCSHVSLQIELHFM